MDDVYTSSDIYKVNQKMFLKVLLQELLKTLVISENLKEL